MLNNCVSLYLSYNVSLQVFFFDLFKFPSLLCCFFCKKYFFSKSTSKSSIILTFLKLISLFYYNYYNYTPLFSRFCFYFVVTGGKSNKEIDPTIGEIKSVAVVEWETTVGCGAFHLEYADFRDRFWVPIHKTIKTVIDKLAKEQKTKKSKKNQNNQIDDKSNGGDLEDIASDSSSTWLPKVEHYDGEHYINDHMNTKDICLEHIKVARRMKRLYISIRRGIKRRHLSCAVGKRACIA